jgi:hypothetical protein
MQWLALIPLVVKLIGYVEEIFGAASGNGAVKKSTVLNAAQAIVEGVASVSTGGQKETWENLAPAVGLVIDATVSVANAAGWNRLVDDNFENMKAGR